LVTQGISFMSQLSFALLHARVNGAAIQHIADRLQLPEYWVAERIEAARLCLMSADVSMRWQEAL
jgi:hypothetical protein